MGDLNNFYGACEASALENNYFSSEIEKLYQDFNDGRGEIEEDSVSQEQDQSPAKTKPKHSKKLSSSIFSAR